MAVLPGGVLHGLLATLNAPVVGYGIRYEFGIHQDSDGWQVEVTGQRLRFGNPGRSCVRNRVR
jgi:starch phosphorylase